MSIQSNKDNDMDNGETNPEVSQELASLRHEFRHHTEQTNKRLNAIEGYVAQNKEDMVTLTGRVDTIVADLSQLTETVSTMGGNVSRLTETVSTMGGNVSRLTGADYESHATRVATHKLKQIYDMTTSRLVAAQNNLEWFYDNADLGANKGTISEADALDLNNADMAIELTDRNDAKIFAVGEVSITAGQTDCTRAIRRAHTVHLATGAPTMPIVAAQTIPEGITAEFGDKVIFLVIPPRQEDN